MSQRLARTGSVGSSALAIKAGVRSILVIKTRRQSGCWRPDLSPISYRTSLLTVDPILREVRLFSVSSPESYRVMSAEYSQRSYQAILGRCSGRRLV